MTSPRQPRGTLRAVASGMRVPQWVKNVLLFVAPGAAGALFHRSVLTNTVIAFFAFSLVASALYLLNDLRDVADDRKHPKKQFRAIASGDLTPRLAVSVAVLLLVGGMLLPLLISRPAGLYLILVIYIAETLAYVYGLKTVPIIEMAFVASGFFLRSYAGAVASHIPVSEWFLVVVSFGALFLVVGKRSAELRHVGASNRAVLREYTTDFLHSALTLAATVVVTAYCLWAFDTASTGLSSVKHDIIPIRLTVVPVVLAILFIIRGAESSDGEAPEDLVLKNRIVQLLGLVWAVLIVSGTYL